MAKSSVFSIERTKNNAAHCFYAVLETAVKSERRCVMSNEIISRGFLSRINSMRNRGKALRMVVDFCATFVLASVMVAILLPLAFFCQWSLVGILSLSGVFAKTFLLILFFQTLMLVLLPISRLFSDAIDYYLDATVIKK